jgi:hypothetical protein
MNGLLSFLLRSGGGILRESAEMFISQALVRAATQRLKGILFFYGAMLVFALASLMFFYVLLYRWLSQMVGDIAAAAILLGVNLLLIAIMLLARSIVSARTPARPNSPLVDMIKSHVEGAGAPNGSFSAGMEIGGRIGEQVRKAAPQIAVGAAVLGLAVSLLYRRQPPKQ